MSRAPHAPIVAAPRAMVPNAAVPPSADLIDIGQIGQMVSRRWRYVVGGFIVGLVAAIAILVWAPRRYEGSSSVVVRSATESGASLLSRIGVPAELAPAALGGSLKSPIETEIQIIGSRAVLGAVADSLGLQVHVIEPRGSAPWQLVSPVRMRAAFTKLRLTFARAGTGWRVSGRGVNATVAAGQPFDTPAGTLVVAPTAPPSDFEVEVTDREQTLIRENKQLDIGKPGGEVVSITYQAPDSLTAAAVPNAIVAVYLQRRRTTDRGINEHRAEFLAAQVDSTTTQLADAERALRAYQEASGVVDPEVVGKVDLEEMSKVREQLASNEVEGRALEALLRDVDSGAMTARQLAAYPSFLRSPAINDILAQITKLETDRTRLLERRTAEDPEVIALSTSITDLDHQLRPLGMSYAGSLARQHTSLAEQAAKFDGLLATLPAAAQSFLRLQRDVKRLSQASLALQAQLMDVRLAAVGEGGDVRRLDEAIPPDRVAFPRKLMTLAVGIAGGTLLGICGALFAGFFTNRIDGTADAERATGLPTARLGRVDARFFAAVRPIDGIAVVPMDGRSSADAVATWLQGTRAARSNGKPRAALVAAALDGHGVDGPPIANRLTGAVDDHHPSAGPVVIAPLTTADALLTIEPGQRAVVVARLGAPRGALRDAVMALELAGATPIGVVIT